MTRRLILLIACVAFPVSAFAGPKEDAEAVFDKFLTAFSAADVDGVVGLFTPDALVWGTGMRELATTTEPVRQYFFNALGNLKPNQLTASAAGPYAAMVLSDNAVLVSGMWQIERLVDGKPTVGAPMRVSIAVVKRGDRWLIAQFHNSPRPNPPAPR
jgi:uncharacterized protein (TIGR02246 family)